jgi:hypothetical protein
MTCTGSQNFVVELRSKASLGARTLESSWELWCIVRTTPSLTETETTVQLKPSVWIRVCYPTTALQHAERSSAFDAIFIHLRPIGTRGQDHLVIQPLDPRSINCIFQDVLSIVAHSRPLLVIPLVSSNGLCCFPQRDTNLTLSVLA